MNTRYNKKYNLVTRFWKIYVREWTASIMHEFIHCEIFQRRYIISSTLIFHASNYISIYEPD
jgi:hypothetical protein